MAEISFALDNTAFRKLNEIELKANFEETKAALTELCEPYANLIVTEDAIPAAKSDRARIRKVGSQIDDYRKMVKQVYTAPLKEFEAKCLELVAVCTEASGNIDVQIKAFEQQKKEAKRAELVEYFNSHEKKHPDFIRINDVYNARWENVSYSIDTAKAEIDKAIEDSDSAVDAILEMNDELFETAMLAKYNDTRDLASALRYGSQLRKMEQERKEAEARKKAEEAAREAERMKQEEPSEEPAPDRGQIPELITKRETAILGNITVDITGTAEEIHAVLQFLDVNQIDYRLLD